MISVCMATHNGEKYLKKQIDSILLQLGDNDELIISDDGSTDSTFRIIESYEDKRIKLYHFKNSINNVPRSLYNMYAASRNFNNALKYAKGDIIFLTDQDDIWKPEKVKRCCEYLNEFDYVQTNFSVIDNNDNLIRERFYSTNPIHNSFLKNLIHPYFWGCCSAFNRKLYNFIYPIANTPAHDFWIGICAYSYFRCFYIDEPLLNHRVHTNNVSPNGAKSPNSLFVKINYRISLVISLLKRRKIIKYS